jgi:8-oxo-dGTP diphosphatase
MGAAWDYLEKTYLLYWAGGVALAAGGTLLAWYKGWISILKHPRAVVAIVYRGDKVVMVRRRGHAEPLTWQFPAGHLKISDDAAVRAIEEVREETGIVCEFESTLGERLHPDTKVYVHYVVCRYASGSLRNLDSKENEAVGWVGARTAGDRITTDLDENVRQFLSKLGKK